VTEEADNNGFLSHSTGLSLDNYLPSFQEYAMGISWNVGAEECDKREE